MQRVGRWVVAASVVAITLPLTALLMTLWIRGWSISAVQSGSMAPNVPKGAAVLIDPADADDIEVGTVISFTDPNDASRTVVHRVHRVVDGPSGRAFETQGDRNAVPDRDLVPMRLVHGRVVRHIVGLGALVDWVAERDHALVLLLVPLAALGANEALGRREAGRRRREEAEVTALRTRVAELEATLSRPLGG